MITCSSHRLQWDGLIANVLIADGCRHQIAQPPQLSRPPTLPRVSGPDATEFDVAVIGGGIAGAAAAWALAPHLRVVVLEAESGLSYHTTGRSAAVLTESYEAEPIRELTGRSRSILTTEFADVSGLLTKRGVLWIVSIGQDAAVERALAAARESPVTVDLLDPGTAQTLCPVLRRELCLAALHEPGAMAIDVDLLQREYLRRARSHGAAVRTNARVTGIRHDEQWYLATNDMTVRCTHVVNAAGAWADEVAIMAGLRPIGLTPLRRTAFLFKAPAGGGHESWPCTIGIDEGWYFEPYGPLMLGSNADEHPDVPRDVRAEDIDVAEAIEKISTITTLSIRRVLKQWAGLRTFAADRLPVVGPDRTEPTFHWYAGLGGFGIMTSPALGRVLADRVLTRPDPAEPTSATWATESRGMYNGR